MVSEAAPAWANALKDDIIKANRTELTTQLAPIREQVDNHEGRLTKVESVQLAMDERLKALENATPHQQGFEPQHVTIKGWCDFEEKDQHGVTRTEATALMTTMQGWLPEELRPHVKEFELRSGKNYSIRVPITPKFLREIANTWRDGLLSNNFKTSRGKELTITLQRSPEAQKMYAMTGRLLDFTKDNCDVEANTRAFWYPDFEVYVEEVGKTSATLIGKVRDNGVVEWSVPGLRAIGMATTGDADSKLKLFRRRK